MRPNAQTLLRRGGFTLLEVILAAGIFVLLAGGVYLVVSAAVSAEANLGEVQLEARQLSAFQDFLRNGFVNLPPEAELKVRSISHGAQGRGVELVIKDAGDAFAIGTLGRGDGVVLGTVPDGSGESLFTLARFSSENSSDGQLAEYLKTAQRLPLLAQIDHVRWRFWDKTQRRFVETWDRGTEHPSVIELLVQPKGEPPRTFLFQLPKLTSS